MRLDFQTGALTTSSPRLCLDLDFRRLISSSAANQAAPAPAVAVAASPSLFVANNVVDVMLRLKRNIAPIQIPGVRCPEGWAVRVAWILVL